MHRRTGHAHHPRIPSKGNPPAFTRRASEGLAPFFAGAVTAALVLAVASQAAAQQMAACAPHDKMTAGLAQRYSEVPHAAGLASNGSLLEVLASADGATWTIIMTPPAGQTCMMASGESWQPRVAEHPTFLQRPHSGDRAPNARPILIPPGGVEL